MLGGTDDVKRGSECGELACPALGRLRAETEFCTHGGQPLSLTCLDDFTVSEQARR
jgi:hypothetical protein